MTQRGIELCPSCGHTDRQRLDRGSRGLCWPCYVKVIETPCEVSDCLRKCVGRYCTVHQRNLRLYGTTHPISFAPLNYCVMEYCYRPRNAHGLCSYHVQIKKRNGTPEHQRQSQIICELCEIKSTVGARGSISNLCSRCQTRIDHVQRTYKLTIDQYKKLFVSQGYRCAICLNVIEFHGIYRVRAVVDHCHTTQKIRGLLCGFCNSGLGQFREQPKNLQRAIEYLLSHQHTPHRPAHPAQGKETATANEGKHDSDNSI